MISYKIEIVINEENEENFDDIIKNIYNHIERIDGITEVHGVPESYFEYNEDINFEEEEEEMTDEDVVAVIKGTETAIFSLRGLGQQAMPTERLKFLVELWEKGREKNEN